ncbi:MAG: hypothetical protein V4724_26475 [Pseudomonadota bacterium]
MSASLSVLAPVPITDSILISSTAPETEYAAWAVGTTYAVGDRRIKAHRIYESLRASNVGYDPTDTTNQTGLTPWWLDVGPTNRYAMFDGEASTQTVIASPLTVVLRPGAFNSLFLAGLDADHLVVTVKDAPGGNVIYSYDADLEGSAPADYYEFFFDRFKPQTDFIAVDIPPYNAMELTLTLSSISAPIKCGVLAVGDLRPLGGGAEYGATAEPKSFNYIKTDDFGNTTIKRRKNARDMSASTLIDLADVNTVIATLTELMGVPCVWVGTDIPEYGGLRTFGLGNGKISYDHLTAARLTLTVQGLI